MIDVSMKLNFFLIVFWLNQISIRNLWNTYWSYIYEPDIVASLIILINKE